MWISFKECKNSLIGNKTDIYSYLIIISLIYLRIKNIHIIERIVQQAETINTEDDSCMSGLVRAMT